MNNNRENKLSDGEIVNMVKCNGIWIMEGAVACKEVDFNMCKNAGQCTNILGIMAQ